jgi:glycosyltransferase involved in cell wall biosynthesis
MGNNTTQSCPVSIIISSFNYDRFLRNAIDSALAQDYQNKQIIVVDDGSTDASRSIISSYGRQIVPVLKSNGGQASAFNAGYLRSSGEVLIFLDSDDVLLPSVLENIVDIFADSGVAKVHWPLQVIDESGKRGERIVPSSPLDEGDLLDAVVSEGPGGYVWPPTTGNAWARSFISRVFPIPEHDYKVCPDLYLSAMAPLYGLVRKIGEPQGLWRIHGQNASWCQPLDERVCYQAQLWERCFQSLEAHGKEKGIRIDPRGLRATSWWHKINRTIDELLSLIPVGGKLVLVDEDQWGPGTNIAGRQRIPFPEKNGIYGGLPANDQEAIGETERLRHSGADLLAVVWTSFWWLQHYQELNRYLRSHYSCLLDNERVIVFDLRSENQPLAVRQGSRP